MATKQKSTQVRLACIEHADVEDEYHTVVSIWLLRILLGSGSAFKGFFEKKRGFMDDDLREFLNFSDKDETKIKPTDLKMFMRTQLKTYERKIDLSGSLFINITLLASRIPLSPIQQQILALIVLKQRYEPLKDCFQRLHTLCETHLYAGLAKTLQSEPSAICKAMSGSATLRGSGLIKQGDTYGSGLDIEPMDGLVEALMSENENEEALLRHFLVPAKPATLDVSDYPHAIEDVELLQGMLTTAMHDQEQGVNVLCMARPVPARPNWPDCWLNLSE